MTRCLGCGGADSTAVAREPENKVTMKTFPLFIQGAGLWLVHPDDELRGAGVYSRMQGDRAAVVFASPNEISSFIRQECQ